VADTPRPTDTELLAELGPLAAVIADKVHTIPVRLGPGGTDDLVSELTLAVAVYVGREVLPAGALALATPPYEPSTTWTIQTHRRGHWQRWLADRDNLAEAREDYDRVIEHSGSKWAFRLVRNTTTFAVETTHTPPAGGAPQLVCKCPAEICQCGHHQAQQPKEA